MDITTDILVIGGGCCGLALSVFLADRGVDFLTVERHASTSILPKAHYLNMRSMEIFRQHGMADDIHAEGTPAYNRSRTKWYTSFAGDGPMDGKTVFETGSLGSHGSEREAEVLACGPTDSSNLPQIRLEPLIRRHAEARAPNAVRFGHEMVSFEQGASHVTATIRVAETGETFRVRARYMVGADGGRGVGKALGVAMTGPTRLITQNGVHFEADLSRHYPDDRVLLNWLRTPYRPGVSVIVAMGPEKWGRHSPEWSMGWPKAPGDTAKVSEDEAIATIRQTLGIADLAIKVRTITEWSVEGVLADRYRVGRVFLAGDAAHRHPPTTGLGLNTGVQDAHNLAWKLAMVLEGKAGDALLDSYEAERRPIGAFNVEWALNAFFNHILLEMAIVAAHPNNLTEVQTPEHVVGAYAGLFADTPNGRMRRARLEAVYRTQHIEFYAQDVEMGFVYSEGAIVADGASAPDRDPMGMVYVPTTRPGHRLPHCWLSTDGDTVSTHDLIGRDNGFVLLTGSEAWAEAASGLPVKVVRIGDGGVVDAEARWRALSETGPDGAILVRPDNVVAWRRADLPGAPATALKAALHRILNG